MYKIKYVLILFVVTSLLQPQMPVSKQATLIESISSAEVMIQATGIYKGKGKKDKHKKKDVEKNGITRATMDAKKSAFGQKNGRETRGYLLEMV